MHLQDIEDLEVMYMSDLNKGTQVDNKEREEMDRYSMCMETVNTAIYWHY